MFQPKAHNYHVNHQVSLAAAFILLHRQVINCSCWKSNNTGYVCWLTS